VGRSFYKLLECFGDRLTSVRDVNYVSAAFSAVLAWAHVDDVDAQVAGFDDSAGAVAHQSDGMAEEPEVDLSGHVDQGRPVTLRTELLGRLGDAGKTGVAVRAQDDHFEARSPTAAEGLLHPLAFLPRGAAGGVLEDHDKGVAYVKSGPLAERADVTGCEIHKVVEPGRAGTVDAPWGLSHTDQAAFGAGRCDTMEVGQFADGVAVGIVLYALGGFATVDMGQDQLAGGSGGGGGKCLDTVAEDQDDVGVQRGKAVGQGSDRPAEALALCEGVVSLGLQLDASAHGPTVGEDLAQGIAKASQEVHAGDDNGQVELVLSLYGSENGLEQPVVGSGACYHRYLPVFFFVRHNGSW